MHEDHEAELFAPGKILRNRSADKSSPATWVMILLGTDYPADMGEVDPIGMFEGTPGLDDCERRAILGGNAARLVNIEAPATPTKYRVA
jgi:hypothetical protein